MAQHTSVEWLQNQLTLALGDELKCLRGLFVVAKEMEKEQIIKADLAGVERTVMTFRKYYIQLPGVLNIIKNIKESTDTHEDGEQYYNETYQTQTQ